ncbi:MAG: methyltransferase domain-containing protein [Anaerolineae bacterium]|nr:methyltransferase domain-containing protein [Anaerolineae bacterium]
MPIQPKPPASNIAHQDTFEQQLRELPAFRALLRAVEARFYADFPMPKPVLDLGCGDGHFASVVFAAPLTAGVDPWWGPLQEAHRRETHSVLAQAMGASLPFPSAHFGAVISNSVLEHIPNVEPVIQEVARVLRPGGWFHFCVPGPNFRTYLSVGRFLEGLGAQKLAERYRRLFDRISRHYYYDTPAAWQARLERAGLQLDHWWSYFSQRALAALEWGHPLGLPSVLAKALTGRWLIAPSHWNLAPTAALLRRFYEEPLPESGAYLFFVARKPEGMSSKNVTFL